MLEVEDERDAVQNELSEVKEKALHQYYEYAKARYVSMVYVGVVLHECGVCEWCSICGS